MQDQDQYCLEYSTPESKICQKIREYTEKYVHGAQMLSGHLVCGLLKSLIQISQSKKIFECGTYTGYSALSMAEAMPNQSSSDLIDSVDSIDLVELVTVEPNPNMLAIAQKFFDQSEHGSKIKPIHGRALDILSNYPDHTFDFIFIDADKQNILDYFKLAYLKTAPNGIIIFDDCLWRGKVLEYNKADLNQRAQMDQDDKRTQHLHALNKIILEESKQPNTRIKSHFIWPIRNGLHLVYLK